MIEINSVGFFGVTQGNIFRQKHFVVDASTDLCIQVASKKDQLKLLKLLRSNKTMSNEKQFRKYRKKPVIIEAYQTDEEIEIETLEGTMKANKGDFIIRGVKGELYPCKPDIFYETYDKV